MGTRVTGGGDQRFFESRKAAALLKHSILDGYLSVWAGKVGRWSKGHTLAIIDGYAGAGRYEDGSAGSPALISQVARARSDRHFLGYFVELDRGTRRKLHSVLEAEAPPNLDWDVIAGDVDDHLDEILTAIDGYPVFAFLDPFGLGLSFDRVTHLFAVRPRLSISTSTEMLYRFDAYYVRRIRGWLYSESPGNEIHLRNIDLTVGGAWWRDHDRAISNEEFLLWIVSGFCERVAKSVGAAVRWTPVRPRSNLQPTYYLVFLTQHESGLWEFGETLSRANKVWRQTVTLADLRSEFRDEDLTHWGLRPDQWSEDREADLQQQWATRLRQNVELLMQEKGEFVVGAEQDRVFDGVWGLARGTHLRQVLAALYREGRTLSDEKHGLQQKRVEPKSVLW